MTVSPLTIHRPTQDQIAKKDSLRLAAVDVGSNSLHMVIAQADPDGGVTTLWRMKEAVGLGRLSFPSRRLSADSMNRAFDTLARFQLAARQRNCEKFIAIATSAVREAHNGGDFVQRVKRELRLFLKVISGPEEARLIYLAVRHALPMTDQTDLIFDIGGGSVEFIVGDQNKAALLESRKLGAARITAQHITSDPISTADQQKLKRIYERELSSLIPQIQKLKPLRCIATSGTLENIAAMCGSGRDDNNPGCVLREDFNKLLKKLLASTSEQRSRMTGLDASRKDQILAGAILVGELFERLDFKRIDLSPAALREGVLLDYLGRHLPDLAIRRDIPDPRRRSVLDLARRCDWHNRHGRHVGHLATRLFDQFQPIHGLGAIERELIEYAAMLHDIGHHIGRSKHHKHSEYLILNGDLKNFTPEEVQIIALIARHHRKDMPSKKHALFNTLSLRARQIIQFGAAILRLADGLDSTHGGVIKDIHCDLSKREIRCRLQATADAQIELWSAKRKIPEIEPILGRSIQLDLSPE